MKGLQLTGTSEWWEYCRARLKDKARLPADIPKAPHQVYERLGWKNWGDWLGTGRGWGGFREFGEAKAFVQSLKILSVADWWKYCAGNLQKKPVKPSDIPASPQFVYQGNGWGGWDDWLGKPKRNDKWRPYSEARDYVRSLGLRNMDEYKKYSRKSYHGKKKIPSDIPATPDQVYKGRGWINPDDWLGTSHKRKYLTFREARAFARKLGLMSSTEWKAYVKGNIPRLGEKPQNIPSDPYFTYMSIGWKGYGDFLATRYRKYRNFTAAKRFARSLRLTNHEQWPHYATGKFRRNSKLPTDIPASPNVVYRHKGWAGWRDWLGTK